MNDTAKGPDYSGTLFLPKTDFPMRAGLPQKEPELLKRWEAMDLYGTLRVRSAGRPKYVLHDGPPYANANIHIGTGLNKILKDVVTRSFQSSPGSTSVSNRTSRDAVSSGPPPTPQPMNGSPCSATASITGR